MADVVTDYPAHIVAFNTWAGEGAPQPPPDSAGLRWFNIVVPTTAALAELRARLVAAGTTVREVDGALEATDPAGNRVRLVVG